MTLGRLRRLAAGGGPAQGPAAQPGGGATSTFEERFARFQLFADCGPMRLFVEGLNEDAKKIGLMEVCFFV